MLAGLKTSDTQNSLIIDLSEEASIG